MADRCDVCGAEALEGQAFVRESITFRGRRCYCPVCHDRFQRRWMSGLVVGLLAAGAAGGVCLWVEPGSRLARGAVTLALLVVATVVATVLHELGHAWAARLAGLRLRQIVLGTGRHRFTARFLGVECVVRAIPFGGLTLVEPGDGPWLRTRWFLMVLAGPATNGILVVFGALYLTPHPWPGLAQFWWQSDPAWILVVANGLTTLDALFPQVCAIPGGRVPSDGLALLQLVFLRRLPFVPVSGLPPGLQRLLRGLGLGVMGLAALACLGLSVWVAVYPGTPIALRFVFAALFGSFTVVLLCLGYRALRSARSPISPWSSSGPSVYQPILDLWMRELGNGRNGPPFETAQSTALALQRQVAGGDVNGAIAVAQGLLQHWPGWLAARVWHANLLAHAGRHADAAAAYQKILEPADLSSPARTVLLAERFKCLARLGEFDSVRAALEAFLAGGATSLEKVFVLDHLACLPFTEGLHDCLWLADEWSARALSLQPANLTLKGTRGALLTELDRPQEAEPLLQEVFRHGVMDSDRGISALYLAIMARRRGDATGAARLARAARRLHPVPWLLERLARAT